MRVDLQDILTRPPEPPDWLVPNLLHRNTMVVWAGQPGVGKSFLSLTLAVALATGVPFLGREVKESRVLYFDEENSKPDFEEYFKWVWRGLGKPDAGKVVRNIRAERFSLAEAPVPQAYMLAAATDFRPDLIVIDTTTAACQIKDENDNGEATEAIQRLRQVQRVNDSTMLLLKHAKVDLENGTHTVRGAKAWVGATDATLIHMVATVHGKAVRTDGLRDSQVVPEKIRAFGLQGTLKIKPSWVGTDGEKGLSLSVG